MNVSSPVFRIEIFIVLKYRTWSSPIFKGSILLMEEDLSKLNDDYYELQNSKDMMAKQIEEKENEYADLENLTKRQKEEFDNLLLNYTQASEKLEEIT